MKYSFLLIGLASVSSVLANAEPSVNQNQFSLKQLHTDMLSLGVHQLLA
jgi:hypothetical protein